MDIPVAHNNTAIVPVQMVAGGTVHFGMGACHFLLLIPCKDLVSLYNISLPISSHTHSLPDVVSHKKHGIPCGRFRICFTRLSISSCGSGRAAGLTGMDANMTGTFYLFPAVYYGLFIQITSHSSNLSICLFLLLFCR